MAKRKMILDLDTGVDDALAIAYALADPEVDLIGIVSSYGNNLLDVCAENSLKLLELLGHTDIPVFKGLPHSCTTDHFDVMQVSKDIHGDNGIGDVELPAPSRALEEQSGVDFYIEAAHKYSKDLIIIPTGPMTNLAAALKKDPEIANLIGNVTFMGGALTVEGNVTPVAEANINQDPKAADEVMKSNLPLTMVGLDVTLRTLLTKNETKQWRELGTASGKAFADITDFYIDAYYNLDIDKRGCALHDPLAVGVGIDPSFVSTISLFMKVVYQEGPYYGRTIGDNAKLNDPNPNVKVAVNVDKERYLKAFMDRLNKLFKEN
ncbi:nucleoside hydrolase [Limosilactobacillus reuteri]|jgi:Inosine-uridine nucleoside N-ribohydrolase|uniref:Nucleoside hydrolase n=1 Tax=Limosilactobacillus reuteri TaxID=1598 RepID=A0A1C1ZL42_LIMRT|nr:nucleoside hydrolase [Limosilactobacillus reuteri]MCC4357687.1 nucleoside hydrolase [Limosilactobacillus reuteri]MCC4363306.1 nucleoside hydrolase [Limosilactobacillus reuteri]MCC4363877.1 nucleoside hydrolase [Limosilactobacillus reuteri]MCC4413931.1 nucleoside hydrolase [Limosilactobacillus reuteri]MCH5378969.1 nucleoside hydrolase [Limosilactobacillus reuteri]